MSIFRTIMKLRDCDQCKGTGTFEGEQCLVCNGTGQVEVLARVSQAAATRAQAAVKTLPPQDRMAAKQRLEDHEEPSQNEVFAPKGKEGKVSKVGKGFIDEE